MIKGTQKELYMSLDFGCRISATWAEPTTADFISLCLHATPIPSVVLLKIAQLFQICNSTSTGLKAALLLHNFNLNIFLMENTSFPQQHMSTNAKR